MKLYWKYNGTRGSGASFGYRIHTWNMIRAIERQGVKNIYDPKKRYDLAIHFTAPYQFQPIRNRKNLLLTMVERIDVPKRERPDLMQEATVIVTPTQFSKNEFSKYFTVPIETCPEGVDPKEFPFIERKIPNKDKKFIYFWNGQSSIRKGPIDIWRAWINLQKQGRLPENAWLYLKTSQWDGMKGNGKVERVDKTRVVLDSRKLPTKELLGLYKKANCFLYPTHGEGWGLGLSEAMSTGLPSIYTKFSATADWPDHSTGFPLTNFKLIPEVNSRKNGFTLDMSDFNDPKKKPGFVGTPPDGSPALGAEIDIDELSDKMIEVYNHYEEALDRGRRASEYLHNNFTWDLAAERFIEICRKYI